MTRLLLFVLLFVAAVPEAAPAQAPRRLTSDGRIKMDAVFVGEGKELVYAVQETFNQFSLMKLDVESGESARLHPGANTSEFAASFSAGGKHYAYVRNNGNLHVAVVIVDAATGETAEHDPGGGFAGVRGLTMAPDAGRVVFAFPDAEGGRQQLFTLSMDGQTRRPLTDGEGLDAAPQFSPDGKWIAFSSTRTGNFDIFVMGIDGSGLRRLTKHEGLDTRPAWSPDGKRIAFTSLFEGNYDIYVMNADGSDPRRLTTHEERDDFPCWHPDGRRLAWIAEREGKHDVMLMELDETE